MGIIFGAGRQGVNIQLMFELQRVVKITRVQI